MAYLVLGIARFVRAITKEIILIPLSMLQAVLRYMGSLYIGIVQKNV